MKLRLERQIFRNDCTIGELTVDAQEECWILEDKDRKVEENPQAKVHGETAIPRGTYNVVITPSPRFQRDLPLLENVPGFEGIRIHPGNFASDTEGCLLPGKNHTDKTVTESRAAFNSLFAKIKDALDSGDTVTIEVV